VLRFVVPILALIAVLATLGGLKACQISTLIGAGKAAEQAGPPPEVVNSAFAARQTWERTLSSVATVMSAKGVAVSNDAAGLVSRIRFESGQAVQKGQILVELDSRVERAQLKSTLARRRGAEIAMKRSQVLSAEGVVAKAEKDADEAEFNSLTAEARAFEAEIERKTVRAPFSGKLGIREVNLGQFLASGTKVTELESRETVFADFTLPQQALPRLKIGMPVRVFQGTDPATMLEGTISAIEPALDAATRAVGVRASLPDGERFRPGMFLNVRVVQPEKDEVIVIPLTAVVHASYGDSVFIVAPAPQGKPGKIARQQFVRLGEERGDFVAVLDGVKVGEEVVSAGAFKLRNRAPIVVDNKVELRPELAPHPENR
jgi:membrane fusion protein (multidrug efflux system)